MVNLLTMLTFGEKLVKRYTQKNTQEQWVRILRILGRHSFVKLVESNYGLPIAVAPADLVLSKDLSHCFDLALGWLAIYNPELSISRE